MNKERVLVVDDEQLNLFIIEEFLAQEDIELEMHSNPLEAWASLSAPDSDFSLVVLDRMMPELDGMELLRRMKRERASPTSRSSCRPPPPRRTRCAKAWKRVPYYYLTKPYEPEALISIVRVRWRTAGAVASCAAGQRAWKRHRR
jgi:DNA-binding response OmpR family regulator